MDDNNQNQNNQISQEELQKELKKHFGDRPAGAPAGGVRPPQVRYVSNKTPFKATILIIVLVVGIIVGIVFGVKSCNRNDIVLTKSNFEDYFTLTSSLVITDYPDSPLYNKATYTYSIKSKFNYDIENNPETITLVIGIIESSNSSIIISKDYEGKYDRKITITLYKSNGYSAQGSEEFLISFSNNYWKDYVYSIEGTIYKK